MHVLTQTGMVKKESSTWCQSGRIRPRKLWWRNGSLRFSFKGIDFRFRSRIILLSWYRGWRLGFQDLRKGEVILSCNFGILIIMLLLLLLVLVLVLPAAHNPALARADVTRASVTVSTWLSVSLEFFRVWGLPPARSGEGVVLGVVPADTSLKLWLVWGWSWRPGTSAKTAATSTSTPWATVGAELKRNKTWVSRWGKGWVGGRDVTFHMYAIVP